MVRRLVPIAGLLVFLFSGFATAPSLLASGPVAPAADPFTVPPGLEPAVEFWKRIFLRYDSSQLVFFDPRDFSKIHEVVKVGPYANARKVFRSVRRRITRRGVPSHRIRMQRGISDSFVAGVRRSGRYMAHMRKVFSARGLPEELAYLPLVESSFRNDARSFRGAVGMWQFMPGTGRRYMRVTRHLDERRDPMEATRAAARLLQENYRQLGTWPLAVTAYNHGRNGMKRAVRQVGSRDIVKIIRRYRGRSFKFASKNFYAEFLAAVHVMREVERHLPGVRYDPLLHLEEIRLARGVAVSSLLRRSKVSRADLLEWNPALSRRARWIPEGYRLKAPQLQSQRLRRALAGMKSAPAFPYHVVARGETLSLIAKAYGASMYDIQAVNGVANIHRLRAGQRLRIPRGKSVRNGKPRTASARRPRAYHRVRRGETLSTIAGRYRVSVAALQRANKISNVHRIRVGQRLRIPGTRS